MVVAKFNAPESASFRQPNLVNSSWTEILGPRIPIGLHPPLLGKLGLTSRLLKKPQQCCMDIWKTFEVSQSKFSTVLVQLIVATTSNVLVFCKLFFVSSQQCTNSNAFQFEILLLMIQKRYVTYCMLNGICIQPIELYLYFVFERTMRLKVTFPNIQLNARLPSTSRWLSSKLYNPVI